MRMGTSKGNPNEIGPCRAKDPGDCPHRSARMDMTQAEADSWMEARARESSDASTHSLSRSGGSSSGDEQSIMQRSRRRSCSSRGKASDARKTRIRKTMAVVMAATAMTSVFMTGPLNATATEATPTQSYSVSQAADKLDHAGEINLKLVEGKPDDLSGEQKYEVTADGDHVADVALKPGREGSTWSAVLKATSGGETGTAETGAIKDSAVTVGGTLSASRSRLSASSENRACPMATSTVVRAVTWTCRLSRLASTRSIMRTTSRAVLLSTRWSLAVETRTGLSRLKRLPGEIAGPMAWTWC